MKRTLLTLAGIGLFCFLLIFRLFYKQSDDMGEEREWFAKALGYEFSAKVDSIRMFNEQTGRLWCRITAGDPQVEREDSLKQYFKEHDKLYLIFHRSGDSIIFIAPNANHLTKGDSITVSSSKNRVEFFHEGKSKASTELTETLTGFGRPFFLKKKK